MNVPWLRVGRHICGCHVCCVPAPFGRSEAFRRSSLSLTSLGFHAGGGGRHSETPRVVQHHGGVPAAAGARLKIARWRVGVPVSVRHCEIPEEPISEATLFIHQAVGRRARTLFAIPKLVGRNTRAVSEACGPRVAPAGGHFDAIGQSSSSKGAPFMSMGANYATLRRQQRLHQSTLVTRSKQMYQKVSL